MYESIWATTWALFGLSQVPLGGSGSALKQLVSTALVFTFVAVWHEPTLLHLVQVGEPGERAAFFAV